ncbi:zinc finger CCHC domain-containing protein 2 isoform X4 [Amblyraja radiata]|uniref:zinc finger CCHC domain-containing protein 2 isoform X4 n=1 Tax=Amblyraja radiata TaxID=386614 RepID=UPI0014041DBE|nr:zinc finger CCHC domain-containing protein 2 isoform X4 [Amblyraja radiata]
MKMKVLMKLPDPEEEEEEEEDEEEEEEDDDDDDEEEEKDEDNDDEGVRADPAMPPPPPQKEAVYEWFGSALTSAQRLEFCCGLLDLCHPLELRFLGSCLEDLARKDYHSLRDSEIRANNAADLATIGDVTDEVVRSKLVVSLALLGSENREAAAVLARALGRIDSVIRNYGLQLTERGVQEFLLLLTMASNHPAFSFHQKETLREQLAGLQQRRRGGAAANGRKFQNTVAKERFSRKTYSLGTENNYYERPPLSSEEGAEAITQRPGVQIENIIFKNVSKKRSENYWEYTFDVIRTDHSTCTVRKTHHDLQEFLTKLPKDISLDAFGKTVLRAFNHSSQTREDRKHSDIESIIRQLFFSPSRSFLRSDHVFEFFGKPSDHSQFHKHFKEDSSEASSQEEDGKQQTLHYKNMGKARVCSVPSVKSPGIGVGLQHSEQNGALDWRKRSYSTKHSTEHCTAVMEHCLTEDKRNASSGNKKLNTRIDVKNKADRGNQRAPVGNGILRIPPMWTGSGKDSDSTSEDSVKERQKEMPPCNPARGSTSRPTAQVAPVQSENGTLPGNPPAPLLPRIPLMPPAHYMMQNGGTKPDYVPPVDSKTMGMIVTIPPAVASLRDSSHITSVGAAETGKRLDLMSSPMSVATPFLLQAAGPALHPMVHRHKMTAPQINLENRHVPGPQPPAGIVNIGSANTAFIPVQSHSPSGKLPASSVLDPTAKPTQNLAGLNTLLPQTDGNIAAAPESAILKVMLPAAALPPQPGSYKLSGTPASVLPLQGTASTPSPVGQIQSTGSSVPTHTPGPVPSLNTALTHSTAQSDSTSYINTIGNTSTNGTIQPVQQVACGACSSCGCRGSCGNNGNPLFNYYYPSTIPSQFIRVPLIPLSGMASLCNGSYLNQAHQNNGTQMPFYQNPYTNGLMHDPMANQTNYGMQQMPGFVRGFPLMYQVANMVTNVNGLGPKKNGTASCYNCGVGGHHAQDCKQPSMEASQPGAFKLKFSPPHDLDPAD